MADQCQMIIGYLVPHRCENPSLGTCVKCGRGYCDEHTNQTREGRVCLACQQGLDQPIALPIAALGMFVGLRAWSAKLGKETTTTREHSKKEIEK